MAVAAHTVWSIVLHNCEHKIPQPSGRPRRNPLCRLATAPLTRCLYRTCPLVRRLPVADLAPDADVIARFNYDRYRQTRDELHTLRVERAEMIAAIVDGHDVKAYLCAREAFRATRRLFALEGREA